TVTNISPNPIAGPVNLAVFVTCGYGCVGTLQLLNQSGTYNGDPYITVSAGTLNPGQSATVPLMFASVFKSTLLNLLYSAPLPPCPLALTCPSNAAQIRFAYTSSLNATGGVLAYTFSLPPGSLPNGLTLNTATGAITGNPGASGTANFTATVTDSTGRAPLT